MGQKMHILKREHHNWSQKQKVAVAMQYCRSGTRPH